MSLMLYRWINAFNALGAQLYFKRFLHSEVTFLQYLQHESSFSRHIRPICYTFGNDMIQEHCWELVVFLLNWGQGSHYH